MRSGWVHFSCVSRRGFFLWGRTPLRLAAFATVRRSWKVCDLGTGSGCLLLLLSGRATGLDLYGVELDPTAARARRDNLMENGLGGTVWTGDWNTLPRLGQVPLTWWSPIRPTLPRVAGPPAARPGWRGGTAWRVSAAQPPA